MMQLPATRVEFAYDAGMVGLVAQVGSRVELRTPTARDAAAFLNMVKRSRSMHEPWVQPPADHDAFSDYLRRIRRRSHIGFMVCPRDGGSEGAIAGVVNVNEIVRGNFQSATLGYFASAEHCGRGYMTEGLKLVVRYCFQTQGLHRLEANIQPENARSIELIKRCGFSYEGFSPRFLKIHGAWCDHERWAILARP